MNNMRHLLLVKESIEGTVIIHIEEAFGGELRIRHCIAQGDARGEHRLAVIATNHCQGWMVIRLFHICSVSFRKKLLEIIRNHLTTTLRPFTIYSPFVGWLRR